MYKYVFKHPFRQDVFKQIFEMSCLDILTLPFYTLQYVRKFKHIWYQIYKADYCLKHLKLV